MSGLEAIGTVASIAQLCVYITRSLAWVQKTTTTSKAVPRQVQRRSKHLCFLSSIISSIGCNTSLQTSDIDTHLQSIKEDIACLELLLIKILDLVKGHPWKRVWRICWKLSGAEREIAHTFTALEQDKSNLQLYIINNFSSLSDQYLTTMSRRASDTFEKSQRASDFMAGGSQDKATASGALILATQERPQERRAHGSNTFPGAGSASQNAGGSTQEGERKWEEIRNRNDNSKTYLGDVNRPSGAVAGKRTFTNIDNEGTNNSTACYGDFWSGNGK